MSTSTSYPSCKAASPSALWRKKALLFHVFSNAVNYLAGAVMLSGLHGGIGPVFQMKNGSCRLAN